MEVTLEVTQLSSQPGLDQLDQEWSLMEETTITMVMIGGILNAKYLIISPLTISD